MRKLSFMFMSMCMLCSVMIGCGFDGRELQGKHQFVQGKNYVQSGCVDEEAEKELRVETKDYTASGYAVFTVKLRTKGRSTASVALTVDGLTRRLVKTGRAGSPPDERLYTIYRSVVSGSSSDARMAAIGSCGGERGQGYVLTKQRYSSEIPCEVGVDSGCFELSSLSTSPSLP